MSSSTFVACGSSDDVQNEWYSPDTDDDFGNNNNSDPTLDLVKKNNANGNPICPYCKIEVEPSDSGDTI